MVSVSTSCTTKDLRKIAADLCIEGYTKYKTKAALVRAINRAQGGKKKKAPAAKSKNKGGEKKKAPAAKKEGKFVYAGTEKNLGRAFVDVPDKKKKKEGVFNKAKKPLTGVDQNKVWQFRIQAYLADGNIKHLKQVKKTIRGSAVPPNKKTMAMFHEAENFAVDADEDYEPMTIELVDPVSTSSVFDKITDLSKGFADAVDDEEDPPPPPPEEEVTGEAEEAPEPAEAVSSALGGALQGAASVAQGVGNLFIGAVQSATGVFDQATKKSTALQVNNQIELLANAYSSHGDDTVFEQLDAYIQQHVVTNRVKMSQRASEAWNRAKGKYWKKKN